MNSRSYSYNYVARSKHKRASVYPSLVIIKTKKLIPCHRVIRTCSLCSQNLDSLRNPSYNLKLRSDGKIGGYRNGVKKKIDILKKEGVAIKDIKVVR